MFSGDAVAERVSAAPLAKNKSVSLVLVWPSTLMQLKVEAAALFAIPAKSFGAIAASVNTNANIVARFGPIMAAPFAKPVTRMSLSPREIDRELTLIFVSVVRMA